MTINFEHFGKFFLTLNYDDFNCTYQNENKPYSLKECADFIEMRMNEDGAIRSADIFSAETGELVATIKDEDDEEDGEFVEIEYEDEDFGFDPYMGCFTGDC